MRHYGAYYKSKLGYEYILDTVPGASLALSLRKLRSAYAGYCIRIRRSSDNAEIDIGFVNNVVDIATILTFIGAGSGYIVTWYDQSLNGNNGGQGAATSQPLFVADAGDNLNNKPSIRLDGANDYITYTNIADERSVFIVVKDRTGFINGVYNARCMLGHSSTYDWIGMYPPDKLFYSSYLNANIVNGTCYDNGVQIFPNAHSMVIPYPNFHTFSFVTAGNVQSENLGSDRNNAMYYWDGDFAEVIIYNTPLSVLLRQKGEQNQKAYYGHY